MTALAHSRPARRALAPRLMDIIALAKSRRALAGLDADALADIGLSRAEALHEARRPVWDMPSEWPGRRK